MALSREEVQHIAQLCRLSMSPSQLDEMAQQLSEILLQFEALNQLDTEDVPPTYHVADLTRVLREDDTAPSLTVDEVLANAPRHQGGQFRVGAVIHE